MVKSLTFKVKRSLEATTLIEHSVFYILEQPCSHYIYHLLLIVSVEQLYRLLGKCAFYGH